MYGDDNMSEDIKQSGQNVVDTTKSFSDRSRNMASRLGEKENGQATAGKAAKAGDQAAAKSGASEAGKATGKAAAQAGTKAAGSAAGGTAAGSAAGGTAAGGAAGSAAGGAAGAAASGATAGSVAGPAGAAVGAALVAFKDTIYYVIIFAALAVTLLGGYFVSMPRVVFGESVNTETDVRTRIEDLQNATIEIVERAYTATTTSIQNVCAYNDYDWELTSQHITNNTGGSLNTDVTYMLCAYSVSKLNQTASVDEYKEKLSGYENSLYTYSYTVKEEIIKIPTLIDTYTTKTVYKPVYASSTSGDYSTVIGKTLTIVYVLGPQETITEDTTRPVYLEKEIEVVQEDDTIKKEKYFMPTGGTEIKACDTKAVPYMEVVVNPISRSTIIAAVGLDLDAWYQEPSNPNDPTTGITNRVMLDRMCKSYSQTLIELGYSIYGGSGGVSVSCGTPLTDQEIEAIIAKIPQVSENRKLLIRNALALVGRVPYFWGGRTGPGWDDTWGTTKTVTCTGDETTGLSLPWGLDCSGFMSWAYKTTFGGNPLDDIGTACMGDGTYTRTITSSELIPGDLARYPGHVGMFIGYNDEGEMMFVHEYGYRNNCVIGTCPDFYIFDRVVAVEGQLEQDTLAGQAPVKAPY